MDRAKAAFFNARHELAGALAKPADAGKAVTELMKSLDIDTENPSSSSANDSTALKVLSLLWGSTAEHGDREISMKIDGYRKRYVAAKGGDSQERAAATRDFDKRVRNDLVNSLGPRNRSIYTRALRQQEQRWENGNLTMPQLHEKMAGAARQLATDCENILSEISGEKRLAFFRNEVKGALGFVSNEENLMQTLNYLWGAEPERGNEDQFTEFDKVTDDLVSMIVMSEEKNRSSSSASSLDRDQAFKLEKREFIAEARCYLGSLLPNATAVKEYTSQEAGARLRYMQQDKPDYSAYKAQMLRHLASMRTEVLKSAEGNENARLDNAVEEAVNSLLEDEAEPRAGSKTLNVSDALEASYLNVVDRQSRRRWNAFMESCDKYVEISMQKNKNEYDSKRAFMRATQKVLIEKLPNEIKDNFKALLVELDSFSENNFNTNSVYNFSAVKLFKKVNGGELGAEDARSKVFLQSSAKNYARMIDGDSQGSGSLQEEVTKALESVLQPDSDPAKVLECLGYFWGVSVSRLTLQGYEEFGIRRNKYVEAHGGQAVSDIPTDCDFIVEARKILVGRMPAEFQEKYKVQQDALQQFGMSATNIARSAQHFLVSLESKSAQ